MAQDGKWQLAFWIVTAGILILTGNVVANDRIRASEDQRIEVLISKLAEQVNCKLDYNTAAHTQMMCDLVQIKTSLGIKDIR